MIHNNIGRGSLLMVGMGHIHHCCFQPDSSTWSSLFLRTSAACLSWKTSRREKSNLFLILPTSEAPDANTFRLCIGCLCKTCFTAQPSLEDAAQERCHLPAQPKAYSLLTFSLCSGVQFFILYGLIVLSTSERFILRVHIER